MAEMTAPDWCQAFFTHCPEMLFVAGLDGWLLHHNLAFGRLLGKDDPEAPVRLQDLVHPEDRGAFAASWSRLQGGTTEPVCFTCRLRDAQGRYRSLFWSVNNPGQRGELYGSAREATAAEENAAQLGQLKEERRLFRLLIDHMPISVWATDSRGTMIFQDGNGGLGPKGASPRMLGLNLFEQLASKPELTANLRRALQGETIHVFAEFGGHHWESWHLPVHDEQGQIVSVFGVTLNITEARETEIDLRNKLALIERQQEAIRALSTPIIQVWDRVLTLPLVGTVDSRRAADVMERLLHEVSRTGARFAILDLTGVETVDTATASHLLALLRAIQLLGAEGVITGIRPVVAQTMISLGLDFNRLITLAKLRDGLRLCMKRLERESAQRPERPEQGGGAA